MNFKNKYLKNKEGDNLKKMYLYKNVYEVLVPYTE